MGNSKVIGGIVVSIAVIAIIAMYTINQDQPGVSNGTQNENTQDSSVVISDSATVTKNNSDYEVDEEGNKKYIITASDAPIILP